MLTYLGVYVGLVLTKFGAGRSTISTPILAFWAIVLTVFVGSREWVGCDFSGYLLRFNFYQKVPFETVSGNAESGFLALNYLVINMGLGYPWLNFFAAVIFFGCAVAFVLKRGDPLSILALMFPVLIVQLAMSGLRQALAVALLMLAWNAFVSRRRVWTLALILAASLFHASAIVFLPMVLLIGRQVSTVTLGLAAVVAMPAVFYLIGERADVYQGRYIESENESLGAIFRVALTVITSGMFELYRRAYETEYPEDFQLMRAFSLFGLGVGLLFFISTLAAHRMNYYVMPVQLVMLSRLPRIMSDNRPNLALDVAPYVVYGMYIVVWMGLSRHASLCYDPYNSYLF